MKIVGIGDLLIPEKYILNGFKNFKEEGCIIETINWNLKNYEELQEINLLIETHGSECFEPDQSILDGVKDADVIITQFCPITKKVIDNCKNLKAIGVLRGGYENVNISYASKKGIKVYHTPGRNANAVADFTVGMLLAECRNIGKSHYNLKQGKWVRDYLNKDSVPDMQDKTVGIIGLGQIGLKVAKRLHSFDMRILAFDPYVKETPSYIQLAELETLMGESDFITLHTRLSEDTERMINSERIDLMKPNAYLINTARSGLVDEKALYDALANHRIMGAALDVFDVEPPTKDYPLITLDNVTVTPHLAGGTMDAFTNSPKLLAEEMIKLLDGRESRYQVNG